MKFTSEKGHKIINDLVKEHNINCHMTKNGGAGCAWYYERGDRPKIKVPPPKNVSNFAVGIHEIAHVLLGHVEMKNGKCVDKRPSYIHEWEAEMYTIEKLKEYGFPHKAYVIDATRYILENVAQAYNRKHPLKKVPTEIKKYCGIKVREWNRYKKVFVPRVELNKYKSKKEIVINFSKPKRNEVKA